MKVRHEIHGSIVDLVDMAGAVRSSFDFAELAMTARMQEAVQRGFVALSGRLTRESQRINWKSLRAFGQFLTETEQGGLDVLPADVLHDFQRWLLASGLAAKTAQARMYFVVRLLSWCGRNVYPLHKVAPAPRTLYLRREAAAAPASALSQDDLTKILQACESEIDLAEAKLLEGRRALLRVNVRSARDELGRVLLDLLRLGGGRLPTQVELNRPHGRTTPGLPARVAKLGGLRELSSYLWLTGEAMFPFYLAIQVQTSANPMALREIALDCIQSHPVRSDLERVVWFKLRSRREQFVDFPAGKHRSAPGNVRRLIQLSADTRRHAPPASRGQLFVAWRMTSRDADVVSWQSLHLLLDRFIERHDLPAFDFMDVRRAGASLHHQATGSILGAKERLNQVSLSSTMRYTTLEAQADHHAVVVNHYQGEFLRLSQRPHKPTASADGAPSGDAQAAETVFGFTCKDPFAGLAYGSTAGSVCLQFHRCASCPGAIVVLDDVETVSKIAGALDYLKASRLRATREGWLIRYDQLYRPTLEAIEKEIVPLVPASILAQVAALPRAQRPLPALE